MGAEKQKKPKNAKLVYSQSVLISIAEAILVKVFESVFYF